MGFDDGFTQTEPQPIAAGIPGSGFIGPVKRLPDICQDFGLDTDPVILDFDDNPPIFSLGGYSNGLTVFPGEPPLVLRWATTSSQPVLLGEGPSTWYVPVAAGSDPSFCLSGPGQERQGKGNTGASGFSVDVAFDL